jgi:hypothetical protein
VNYSKDHGVSWEIISPDLTSNDSLKLKDQHKTGGLTPDVTNAENHCTILCISASSYNQGEIWVGTDDGHVQLTRDGGKSWTNLSRTIKDFPKSCWVPQITLGASAGEAWVVANNYRQGDSKPYLFYTSDYGKTWINAANNNEVFGHCLSVVQDSKEPKLVFLGTEHGLYVSFDKALHWHKWTHDYPNVATQDLKIHPRESDLIIGTFGRALYILDNIEPLRVYAREGAAQFEKSFFALPSPEACISAWQQPAGERFPADMYFAGENKSKSGELCFWYTPELKKETSNKKKETKDSAVDEKKEKKGKDEKVTIHILSLAGDTLRTLKHEPDTGLNIVNWYFETRGIRFPSKEDPKKEEEEEEGGPTAKPGTYKVYYTWNEFKDSSTVTVGIQPGLNWNESSYTVYVTLRKDMEELATKAEQAYARIRSAEKSIGLIKDAMTFADDSTKKKINERIDSLQKKIDPIKEYYFGKEEQKGIQDDSHTLVNQLYTAFYSIDGFENGTNARAAINNCKQPVDRAVEMIENCMKEEFVKLQSLVDQTRFNYYKNP